jgi:hypothetical protein
MRVEFPGRPTVGAFSGASEPNLFERIEDHRKRIGLGRDALLLEQGAEFLREGTILCGFRLAGFGESEGFETDSRACC